MAEKEELSSDVRDEDLENHLWPKYDVR